MKHSASFLAYDTLCTVTLECEVEAAEGLLQGVEAIALEVEKTLSMYDPSSELSLLCAGYEVGKRYPLSPMLFDFLSKNLFFARLSVGAFDPTVGPVIKLWDFLADPPRIPDDAALRKAQERVGYEWVHIYEDSSISFDKPCMQLDPGASGKGYALGLCADFLKEKGIKQAVLNFGGNIYAIGGKETPEGERPYKVALIDPDDTSSYIGTVELMNRGIATSSYYEHSFETDGVIYHHLVNPRTGRPQPLELKSAAIISSSAAYTDFLSTVLFMLGEEKFRGIVEELSRESGEMIGYVAVTKDREILVSPNVTFQRKG